MPLTGYQPTDTPRATPPQGGSGLLTKVGRAAALVKRVEQERMKVSPDAAEHDDPVPCAATVQGGGQCKTPRMRDELFCRRHLEVLKKTAHERMAQPESPKPQQARNGTADESWKDVVLGKLFEQREIFTKKVADIDQTITVVKGL